ncbi:uncharacterized protein BDV17DRAFT_295755 [Aspergillus undulatus]|uniref:uncharacterized protein n=1 Tax=Aspergillus undulatus TaxID=1810928 RepID=UPI003CCD5856
MLLRLLAVLSRLGALSSSIVVLGLNAKFITQASWLKGFLIYIQVVASVGTIAAVIPPYPNFLYDLFWTVAWIVAARFALVVQFAESICYGLRLESEISCATYKASTAFTFLALLAWLGSSFLGGLRILALLANVGDRYWGRPLYFGATSESETVPREKLRRVEGLGNSHVARWFICYILLGVILIAVGIPILIIYAGPVFARYLIAGLQIPHNVRIELKNSTSDSIGVIVDSDVRVPAADAVTFYPMNVSFFSPSDPDNATIASVMLPELKYGSGERLTVPEQRPMLEDLDAFAQFIETVAFNKSFSLGGWARAKVRVALISTWVDLRKTVQFTGFSSFPTLEIPQINLKPKDADGYNVHAKIEIDNPTPTSATLGNVTIALSVSDIILGEARANVAIIPGRNTFDVDAKLNVTNLQDNMETILRAEIPYLRNEEVLASASVSSVLYEGQRLAYWEEAFGRLELTLTRPVRSLMQSVLDSGVLSGTIASLADFALDNILENVKEMADDDLDAYLERLSDIAKSGLNLLSTMDIL